MTLKFGDRPLLHLFSRKVYITLDIEEQIELKEANFKELKHQVRYGSLKDKSGAGMINAIKLASCCCDV